MCLIHNMYTIAFCNRSCSTATKLWRLKWLILRRSGWGAQKPSPGVPTDQTNPVKMLALPPGWHTSGGAHERTVHASWAHWCNAAATWSRCSCRGSGQRCVRFVHHDPNLVTYLQIKQPSLTTNPACHDCIGGSKGLDRNTLDGPSTILHHRRCWLGECTEHTLKR